MIKQVILLALVGLAFSYPVQPENQLDSKLARLSEKLEQLNVKTGRIYASNVHELIHTVQNLLHIIPDDLTLSDISILATQAVYLTILEMQPVPVWFEDVATKWNSILMALMQDGTTDVTLGDLRPLIDFALNNVEDIVAAYFPEYATDVFNAVDALEAQLNQLSSSTTVDQLARVGTQQAVSAVHDANIHIPNFDNLVKQWIHILDISAQRNTDAVTFDLLRPLIRAGLDFLDTLGK